MEPIRVMLVAGARPNFMKIAPILRQLERHGPAFRGVLVRTGQHYDENMSGTFFRSLGIRAPDHDLGVGSGSHAEQTAGVMLGLEPICLRERPDLMIVVGDVNSTLAAGLVARKLGADLAHVEAGLRSGDRDMPEEINRIATDAISDLLFTTEAAGTRNLLAEGHGPESVHFVGHVMVDNLLHQLARLGEAPPSRPIEELRRRLPARFVCLTLHRPSNVDDPGTLGRLVEAVGELARETVVLFPCHPRTRDRLQRSELSGCFRTVPARATAGDDTTDVLANGAYLMDPLGYDDFLYLWRDAALVITDSGGLQEETTALKVPCLTLRATTERPSTVEIGSNLVVGTDTGALLRLAREALGGRWKPSRIPELWDGKAGERIVQVILEHYGRTR